MAIRAVLRVKLLALCAQLLVNRKGILRRLFVKQPLFDPRHLFQINCRWKCAGAEGGTLIAFFHHAVVAVPMGVQLLRFARTLQPDRWKVTQADQLTRFQLFERKFQKCFCRIERIGSPRSLLRLPIDEAKMVVQHDQSFAHYRNRVVAHEETIN